MLGAGLTSYAVELLSEYVSRPWIARLQAHLGCAAAGAVTEGGVADLMSPGAAQSVHPSEGANKKPKLSKVRCVALLLVDCTEQHT